VPIESVSKMLGHNNIKTTQIYASEMSVGCNPATPNLIIYLSLDHLQTSSSNN